MVFGSLFSERPTIYSGKLGLGMSSFYCQKCPRFPVFPASDSQKHSVLHTALPKRGVNWLKASKTLRKSRVFRLAGADVCRVLRGKLGFRRQNVLFLA